MPDLVRFTETMRGWLAPTPDATFEAAERAGRAARTELVLILTVVTPDVDRMVADPNRRSPAFGCLLATALHPEPLTVEDGHLDLFVDAEPARRILHMRYGVRLRDADGGHWFLRGTKVVSRRRWFPTALWDTTTLFTDVWAGADEVGPPRWRGILRMGPVGLAGQLSTFRGEGAGAGLAGIVRFLVYYMRRVLWVYTGPPC